ncbi:hypothetical protein CQA49_09670 [Helicobacter sp. MIT 00-7814]|uniref:hypothetical protein n=1 Tax=unclassified Helicobacter TaxID=2593540 RepID=UPI000E1F8456|nr:MULTISPECIES: hypothetical protein [unclassified Helicobacter]RDU51401.1 hypothetical protein CQA49_09670 [Helicobacter sp. MIT 00-7814]RDU51529.1 hypothetical protein CQA37_09660 [Helicobacter sp. MIT 99-10781]
MNFIEFILNVKQKRHFISVCEFEKLEELLSTLDSCVLEELFLRVCANEDFPNFKKIINALREILIQKATNQALKAKIKAYKGSSEQEQNLLRTFFLKNEVANAPQWFKEIL